jgi:CRP-like cAMP-binding protein
MSHPSLHDLLASLDLFAGVPEEVLEDVIGAGATIHTPAGKEVVTQGAADAGLHVVLKGGATITVNGREHGRVSPGDYFGEISLIDGLERSATLTAEEGGLDTFAISPWKFSPLIDQHPPLARSLLRCLTRRIRDLEAADPSPTL